ncbi:DUF4129 domain-containing protein [Tellurirhabdus bombi]|uniref:DUF4129 domain-containing protein n=1 Tax=Tellurirhabdus bombi TaxID=2907205 RepID=UPI001F3BB6FB|nr:DUF4129 domain-containing protein [Tellurirhabdus bombi]
MKVIINRRVSWCFFALLFWLSWGGFAQQPAQNDRSRIELRRLNQDKLEDYRTSRDYQYDREAPPPQNPLAKFWAWVVGKIQSFLRSSAYENVWQYVFLAVFAGFVIWLLVKADVTGIVFGKAAKKSALGYQTITDNIHEINFSERIEEAIGQKAYRLAIRLLYLQTLKDLSDRELITWKPDKTNHSYVLELAQTPYQSRFAELTRQFEYAWYGDFPVTEERFGSIRETFRQFFGSAR